MSSGTRLFISNIPENIEQSDLRSAFSAYGEITSLDLKSKSTTSDEQRKFAFVTLIASNYDIESCIKYFSNENVKGSKLYVTRARESFLERLQREREQAQKKETEKSNSSEHDILPKGNPIIKLEDKLNPRKRKFLDSHPTSKIQNEANIKVEKFFEKQNYTKPQLQPDYEENTEILSDEQKKKNLSDKKRIESMKKKRQEFNEKRLIIKTGLISVDKIRNKKILFSAHEDNTLEIINGDISSQTQAQIHKNNLFLDDGSEDEVNFEIKEHFEGKEGQKVLALQSRYKSDKRFILNERFIEDKEIENETDLKEGDDNEEIQLEQTDEKVKQLNILQDVLGVVIMPKSYKQDNKKSKSKMGMLRFDPSQPDHAKFVVPIEDTKQELPKKKNRKSMDEKEENKAGIQSVVETVKVSKEQFYKVSETLKETIAQTTSFSLRSLFTKSEDLETGPHDQEENYISIATTKKPKVKKSLDPGERNPFVYDSSDSETETIQIEVKTDLGSVITENKAVWKENLFFSLSDHRLREGLEFFNQTVDMDIQKERRELKSLMKKRIYNKERKNQMFQKKIGGRKKTMKKSFRKK